MPVKRKTRAQKLMKKAEKRKRRTEKNRENMRNYMRQRRQDDTFRRAESVRDTIRHQKQRASWTKTKKTFEKNIRLGFTIPCSSCGRLWPQNSVYKLTKDELIFDGKSKEFVDSVFSYHTAGEGLFCQTCRKDIKSYLIPRFCLINDLMLPVIDKEIEDLNRVEERIIAPNHVFQTIWPVMGPQGQYKTKGAIVNVPVMIDTTVSSLPRPSDDTNMIHIRIARKLEYKNDYMSGFVRLKKVYDAAKKIVEKPLLQELGIHLALQQYTTNDIDMSDYVSDDEDIMSIDTTSDQDFNIPTQETLISSDVGYRIAPAEGLRPKGVLLDENIEFLAFPKLFGGYKMTPTHNNKPLPYSDFAKSIVMQKDRRCANRGDFLLFMAKKLELMKLSANVNVCLRKKIIRRGHTVTASDLLNSHFVDGLIQHDDGYKILRGIRSSAAHWQEEKTKVMAMIRQFGLPTLFITLSSADTRWPELLVQLKKTVDNIDISESDAANLPYKEKARLIQSDPVTCSLHFDRRFKCLKKTWKSKNGPFKGYEISHFYHRIEFQQRGYH